MHAHIAEIEAGRRAMEIDYVVVARTDGNRRPPGTCSGTRRIGRSRDSVETCIGIS
ncbi:MAG: hypothetical protein U0792_09760 [Gemmataceae bacterium]